MRRSVSLFIFLALCIGFFSVTSQAPARAMSSSCAAFNGSYSSAVRNYTPDLWGDWLFEPGETLTVTVTSADLKVAILMGDDLIQTYFIYVSSTDSGTVSVSHTFTSKIRLSRINVGWFGTSDQKTLTWYCTPAPFAGPAVPAGYELRTITCDVAVFDGPGGKPIGENRIKAGQTFYVNPKSEKAADGEFWSKVFVSGYTDPWIPTKCIGG